MTGPSICVPFMFRLVLSRCFRPLIFSPTASIYLLCSPSPMFLLLNPITYLSSLALHAPASQTYYLLPLAYTLYCCIQFLPLRPSQCYLSSPFPTSVSSINITRHSLPSFIRLTINFSYSITTTFVTCMVL